MLKKSGATRKVSHKPYSQWMVILFFFSLFSVLVFFYLFKDAPVDNDSNILNQTAEKKETDDFPYTFYNKLPSRKVDNHTIVPERIDSANHLDDNSKTQSMILYQLQVGAFNELKGADSMKAKLALVGVVSNIQMQTNNGRKLYKVRIGPSTDLQKIKRIQDQLKKNNYKSFIQKL